MWSKQRAPPRATLGHQLLAFLSTSRKSAKTPQTKAFWSTYLKKKLMQWHRCWPPGSYTGSYSLVKLISLLVQTRNPDMLWIQTYTLSCFHSKKMRSTSLGNGYNNWVVTNSRVAKRLPTHLLNSWHQGFALSVYLIDSGCDRSNI